MVEYNSNEQRYIIKDDFNCRAMEVSIPYRYARQLYVFMLNEYNQAEVSHMLDCMEDSDIDYDFYREYLKIISEDPANKKAIIADTANRYQEWLDYDCNERSSKDIEEIFCDVIRDWMI